MSMLKGKVGFVIPKNKFSGSLVPIFKKSDINRTPTQDTNKQPQRTTRWGPDPTLDPTVKRAKALAYQTRVDQITQQLNLGLTGTDNHNSTSVGDAPNDDRVKLEKRQGLDLERREAIGEILKLNPAYKIPSDYEPVLREATVPIPVKAHPEYNFLGLVYGSDGETQKRLEKDTGTTIQVYGTVMETGKKMEIIPFDGSEILKVCDEAYVRISADTYEKVDAAADLIELLLNSVLVKPSDSEAIISVSGEGQDLTSGPPTSMASQEIMQPVTGDVSFQQYPISWFPAVQSGSPSGVTPIPSSGPLPFSPSFQHPSFGRGPPAPYFGSSPQSSTITPQRSHSPAPVLQGMLSAYRVAGHLGPPRNFSPLGGHQSSIQGSPRVPAPQLAERPLIPTPNSPGWPLPAPPSALSISPSQYPSPQGRPSGTFGPSQIRSSSGVQFQSFTPQIQLTSSRSSQFPPPRPSSSPRPHPEIPNPGHPYGPSFTPLNSTGPSPRGSSDFTFKPHLPQGPPSQSLHGNDMHFSSQRPNHSQFSPVPQMSSFRPALQSPIQQPNRQSFQRPLVGNQMGPSHAQFGGPNLNLHMGIRNHGPVPQFPNNAGSLPHRAGPASQFQQSQSRPRGVFGGNQHPGRPQVYDPFLPSSLPQGGNTGVARKQESDPEYEDLMASVGVK